MTAEYIIKTADSVFSKCGTRDPFNAAEACGATVAFKDLGSLKGAYFGKFTPPAIVIGINLDEHMQRIVCAHELGHHMLHSGVSCSCREVMQLCDTGKLEREANLFAAALLVDPITVENMLIQGYTVAQTAAILDVDEFILKFFLNGKMNFEAPNGTVLCQ